MNHRRVKKATKSANSGRGEVASVAVEISPVSILFLVACLFSSAILPSFCFGKKGIAYPKDSSNPRVYDQVESDILFKVCKRLHICYFAVGESGLPSLFIDVAVVSGSSVSYFIVSA